MCKTLSAQTIQKETAQQTYRFEFGSDNKIYSVSFKGSIREPEIRGILQSAQNSLYEKCGEAIRDYLDAHNLNYSKFTAEEKLVNVTIPIKFAGKVLLAPSCSIIDKWIGAAEFYYSVMDCQNWTEDCCEGCYFVLARYPSGQNGKHTYHAISQTFVHTASGSREQSRFAIRKDDGEHRLVTLDKEDGYPVLETFGCMNLLNLLVNITNITTKQQAADFANI